MPRRPHLPLAHAVAPIILGLACKEVALPRKVDSEVPVVEARTSADTGYYAADTEALSRNSTFFFRVWNDTFTRRLDDLPVKGEALPERMPYSGGYYPEQEGGTDVIMVGNKSPLQKYDDAFHGGQNRAVAWERDKHTTGPVWAGHCNGFSAAAQRHPQEPARNVTRNGVVFSPQDVKALLAELYMSADYEFLGGNRCNRTGDPPSDRVTEPEKSPDPTVMDPCEDINPGTLHAAMANWIGRMRHPLIMDMFSGDEVWNFPLYKYEVVSKEMIPESLGKQYVTNAGGEYLFNPVATKFALLHTKLTYAEAVKREVIGQLYPKVMELYYVLELNQNGEILGGEWVGSLSRKSHPDFLWVALEPMTPNGTRYMGNPHVDSAEVLKLWAESAGLDPANPPRVLKRPVGPEEWGRWPAFEVTLDGNRRGAVFAGKQSLLRVTRKGALAGSGVALDISLDGAPLKSLSPVDVEEVRLGFEPTYGMHRLQFVWKKDGNLVDDQFLRFHVVP